MFNDARKSDTTRMPSNCGANCDLRELGVSSRNILAAQSGLHQLSFEFCLHVDAQGERRKRRKREKERRDA